MFFSRAKLLSQSDPSFCVSLQDLEPPRRSVPEHQTAADAVVWSQRGRKLPRRRAAGLRPEFFIRIHRLQLGTDSDVAIQTRKYQRWSKVADIA